MVEHKDVGSIPTKGTNKTFGSSMVKLHEK